MASSNSNIPSSCWIRRYSGSGDGEPSGCGIDFTAGGESSDSRPARAAVQQLETVNQREIETIEANTQAVNQNSAQLGQGPHGGSMAPGGERAREHSGVGTESADFGDGGLLEAAGDGASVPPAFLCRRRWA